MAAQAKEGVVDGRSGDTSPRIDSFENGNVNEFNAEQDLSPRITQARKSLINEYVHRAVTAEEEVKNLQQEARKQGERIGFLEYTKAALEGTITEQNAEIEALREEVQSFKRTVNEQSARHANLLKKVQFFESFIDSIDVIQMIDLSDQPAARRSNGSE